MEAFHDGELVRQYHPGPTWRISKVDGVKYRFQRFRRARGEEPVNVLSCHWSEYVSRFGHCEIVRRDHVYWIRHLGSNNGTFLNGAPMIKERERELRFGDIIGVGVNPLETYDTPVTDKAYCIFKFQQAPSSATVECVDLVDDDDDVIEIIDDEEVPSASTKSVDGGATTTPTNNGTVPLAVPISKPNGRPKPPPPPIISNKTKPTSSPAITVTDSHRYSSATEDSSSTPGGGTKLISQDLKIPSTPRNTEQPASSQQSQSPRSPQKNRSRPGKRIHASSSDDSSDGLEVISLVSSKLSANSSASKTAPTVYSAVSSEDSSDSPERDNDEVDRNKPNHCPDVDVTPKQNLVLTPINKSNSNRKGNISTPTISQVTSSKKESLTASKPASTPVTVQSNKGHPASITHVAVQNNKGHPASITHVAVQNNKGHHHTSTFTPKVLKRTARKRTCVAPPPKNKIRKTLPSSSSSACPRAETEPVSKPKSPSIIISDNPQETNQSNYETVASVPLRREYYSDYDDDLACSQSDEDDGNHGEALPPHDTQANLTTGNETVQPKPTPKPVVVTSTTTTTPKTTPTPQRQQLKKIQCLDYAPPPRFAARAQKKAAAFIAPIPTATPSTSRNLQNRIAQSWNENDNDQRDLTKDERKQMRIDKLKEIELRRQQEREANKKEDTPKPKVPAKVKFTNRNRAADLADSIKEYHDKQ